jgi:hypothetical protein
MALLHMDGFDWAAAIADLDNLYARTGTVTLTTSGGRNGGGAIVVSASANSNLQRGLGNDYTTLVIGAAWKDNATVTEFPVFQLTTSGGSAIFTLTRSSGGVLTARRGAGSGTIIATGTISSAGGTFHYIECKVVLHASTGSVETRVNGVVDINDAGLNTEGAVGGARNVRLGSINISGQVATFDDWYVDDANFIGDMTVACAPAGEDQTPMDMTNATGGGDMYEELDELPNDGDTSYGTLDADGERAQFGVADPSLGASSVIAVCAYAVARQENSGSHGLILGAGANGTLTDSAKQSLTTTKGGIFGTILETNPDTAVAWVPGDFAAGNAQVAAEYEP